MAWLKNVVVDIVVTILIVLVTSNVLPAWADWIVLVYTPFIFLVKAVALFSGVSKIKQKKPEEEPPEWFLHTLYAINVAALLYAQWWIFAGIWAITWLFSFIQERRG